MDTTPFQPGRTDPSDQVSTTSGAFQLDRAALARGVATREHDHHLRALGLDPVLELDQLELQAGELAIELLTLHRLAPAGLGWG
jgi:hypothetical protein